MNVSIKIIPHKKQRYDTVGDWWFTKNGDLEIRISKMGSWKYEMLVAVHELCEVLICKSRGISEAKVTKFDIEFEKKRKKGNVDEPGNDQRAPYFYEHQFATMVEEDLSRQLEVPWSKYDKKINSL